MVQDLLDIVEGEATEDSKTTIQPDTLRPHQSAGSGGGKDQRSETGESNDGDTGKKGTAKVQVLLLFRGGTDESDRAHHSNGVETSASKDSRVDEHQRGQKSSLGHVKGTPKGVLCDIAIDATLAPNFSCE